MEVVDCIWEITNLGRKTVEITIEDKDEVYDDNEIISLYKSYDYVVFKVPMMKTDFNTLFTRLGFVMIEVQMNMVIHPESFNYGLLSEYYDNIFFKDVEGKCVDHVCERITPDMFSTDRISIDKQYGPVIGMRRYQNWIKSEIEKGTARLVTVFYKNKEVGFMLYRLKDKIFTLLLNGLYKEWQGKRLGIITPASPLLLIRKNNIDVDRIETCISSNNIPVVKLYDRLGYNFHAMKYVYVKHEIGGCPLAAKIN